MGLERLRIAGCAVAALLSLAAHAAALEGLPAGIVSTEKGDGWQFADAKGMTLYTLDRDEGTPGKSSCTGDCATAWPPVVAPPDAKPHGPWSTITRDDGTLQWAYRGKPLYRYIVDPFPGATFGEGVATVWHVAFQPIPVPGEVRIGPSVIGQVLTDIQGHTLYTSDADRRDRPPSCDGKCLEEWRAVAAPWVANAFGNWSVVVRPDGFRQWAYQGKPLYRHAADVRPGELTGANVAGWHASVLEPAPPLPPWATIQPSDAGELIGNAEGLTVYTHDLTPGNRRYLQGRSTGCVGECVDPQWVPLIAAGDAKPTGVWSLIALADGRHQWAYKGMKVYTNAQDRKPGDFKGIRFGGDRSFAAIMRNGLPMQGTTVGG